MGTLLAFLVSFLHAAQNTSVKKAAIGKIKPIVLTWAIGAFSLVALLPLHFGLEALYGPVKFNDIFWIAFAIKLPLATMATLFYVLAHRHSDMSLINPLLSITPVIVLLIAPFTVNQQASLGGIIGVGLVVVGVYVLNFGSRKTGYLEPFKLLFRDKGARYMMATATIWGVTTIIDVVGVQNAGANRLQAGVAWAFLTSLGPALILAPFIFKDVISFFNKPAMLKKVAPAGLINGVMGACQMVAMTMILAVYVNAIKRFSMVLSVIIGTVFLKEEGIQERLTGSIIMLVGVVIIALAQ